MIVLQKMLKAHLRNPLQIILSYKWFYNLNLLQVILQYKFILNDFLLATYITSWLRFVEQDECKLSFNLPRLLQPLLLLLGIFHTSQNISGIFMINHQIL